MNIIMSAIGIIWAVIIFASGFSALLTFDKIIKLEYQNHSQQWKKDGKPSGFFWGGMATSTYSPFAEMTWTEKLISHLSLYWFSFVWLFLFPKWIYGDAELENLFHRYRIRTIIYLGLALTGIALSHK